MEQSTPLNDLVKQIKGQLSFLTPSVTFIVNAAFAVVAFVLFILQGDGHLTLASMLFHYAGGIIGFLVLIGLLAGSVALPLKKQRLSPCFNFFIAGFMLLFDLMALPSWGVVTILLVILILLPWMAFTFIKLGDEVRL